MKKLIQGIVDFRKALTEENRALFTKLASGQTPDTLFIACSDSRVVPNLFASTNPGDLFVLRNIGNLIPPADAPVDDNSAAAALEFAVNTLKIPEIIVCGHSECGAMQTLMSDASAACPHLINWLKYGKKSLERVKKGEKITPHLSEQNQLSQLNVLQQIEHIHGYPFVQKAIEQKRVRIHGWWFDIAHADVYCYEKQVHKFVLIDEKEADAILQRLPK